MIYGFGRQEVHLNQVSARLAETRFGSRREFRPPNPSCEGSFRLPKVPPNLAEFRLCPGLSAAEGAAESALFSHFLHVSCDVFRMF